MNSSIAIRRGMDKALTNPCTTRLDSAAADNCLVSESPWVAAESVRVVGIGRPR